MMVVLAFLAFAGTAGLSAYMIWSMIAPNVDRISRALFREPAPAFYPLTDLVRAERRIAIRRWAASSRPSPAMLARHSHAAA